MSAEAHFIGHLFMHPGMPASCAKAGAVETRTLTIPIKIVFLILFTRPSFHIRGNEQQEFDSLTR